LSRLQADIALLFVAIIWGAAFVAQKDAMGHVGPYTFVVARFGISALLAVPLAMKEMRRGPALPRSLWPDLGFLMAAFIAGVVFQQAGVALTSVTNAGFLTGLYVLFTAIICRVLYKQELSKLVLPAALLSVAGVGLLSGGLDFAHLGTGDLLVLFCAIGFGFQVALIGSIMEKAKAPFRVCFLQYAAVALACLAPALALETPSWDGIYAARWAILYAGVLSGGIAYTMQVVAQQYTPASDSAVIMSAESVFAALFGMWLMGDRLDAYGMTGCALIITAILMVEFSPMLFRPRKSRA
jgi:drug/metabolite transporter (DMT)-like permease